MSKHLENLVGEKKQVEEISRRQYLKNAFTNYLVDTTAGITYFAPTMATIETLCGMEPIEVLKVRAFSAASHIVITRPYGKFREFWAKLWNTDAESSKLRKFAVDTSSLLMIGVPLYATGLYLSGASLDEGSAALTVGTMFAASSGRPFGWWMDKWRKFWGKKPTLEKYHL